MRRRGGRFRGRRGATRLLMLLSAMLFALSIVTQIAASTASAALGAPAWLCAKAMANADGDADSGVPQGGHASAGLGNCDHCAIAQAPMLPAVAAEEYLSYPVETRGGFRADCGGPRGKRPASASLARAPPIFS